MELSRHAGWALALGLCISPGASRAEDRMPIAQIDAAPPSAAQNSQHPLARRIDALVPQLLRSLSEARRVGEPALVRCFDRAVSALHGVERQVRYHAAQHTQAERLEDRRRHQRALEFLARRVDELSRSGETCFTDGTALRSGETLVEVVLEPQ